MPLRDLILIAGVGEVHAGLVQLFARQSALLKQVLATIKYFLLGVELLIGGLCFELRLLNFLWQVRGRGGGILRLGLIVRAFILLCGGGEVSVLKHGEQLPDTYVAPAI